MRILQIDIKKSLLFSSMCHINYALLSRNMCSTDHGALFLSKCQCTCVKSAWFYSRMIHYAYKRRDGRNRCVCALTSIASHCFFSLSKEKRDFDTLFPELHASCAFHLTAHCCLSRSKEAKVGSTMQQQHITYLRCFITHLCYYYNYTIHISIPTRHMFAF